MLKLFYTLPNGKSFAHVSRSGTSTIAAHALKQFYPDRFASFLKTSSPSPQSFLDESWGNRLPAGCVCMVREPEDRLRSMIARNGINSDTVSAVLDMTSRVAVIPRRMSRELDILGIIHLAPICNIAENDSKFVLWPNIEEACAELGLEYDPDIKYNQLKADALVRYEGINLFDVWKERLLDSTILHAKLSITPMEESFYSGAEAWKTS